MRRGKGCRLKNSNISVIRVTLRHVLTQPIFSMGRRETIWLIAARGDVPQVRQKCLASMDIRCLERMYITARCRTADIPVNAEHVAKGECAFVCGESGILKLPHHAPVNSDSPWSYRVSCIVTNSCRNVVRRGVDIDAQRTSCCGRIRS